MDDGVGSPAWRDIDRVVGEAGEISLELVFVDPFEGLDECVVLTVAGGGFLIFATVDEDFDGGDGFESLG